jgi:hypothetical protein
MCVLGEPEEATGVHVAVFVEPYLSAVLDGRKTMESRFGLTRQPPYDCVDNGDIILLKRSGGPVVGIAEAGETWSYTLSPDVLRNLRERFAGQLFACDEEFWSARRNKNYATLIEIKDTIEVDAVTIPKRDRRGWVSYVRKIDEGLFPVA